MSFTDFTNHINRTKFIAPLSLIDKIFCLDELSRLKVKCDSTFGDCSHLCQKAYQVGSYPIHLLQLLVRLFIFSAKIAKERGVLELEISETDIIYKSLLHYENQIRILKGQQILSNIKNNVELKRQAFKKIRGYIRNTDNCL